MRCGPGDTKALSSSLQGPQPSEVHSCEPDFTLWPDEMPRVMGTQRQPWLAGGGGGGAGEGCAGNVMFELGLKGWLWILGPGEEESLWREAWKGTAYPRHSKRWREEGAGQRMKMENKRGAKLDFVLACSRSQVMWDLNSSLRSLHQPEEQSLESYLMYCLHGGAPMTERKRPKQRCLFQTRLPVKPPVDRVS